MSRRHVGVDLMMACHTPVELHVQVAVAPTTEIAHEQLLVSCDGVPLDAPEIVVGGNRVHLVSAPAGTVSITYRAGVDSGGEVPLVTAEDRARYLRPSRYAEADRLVPTAQSEFGGIEADADLVAAVSSWVGGRLAYVPGSSGPTDGAVDSLLLRRGVCRDYAHLVVGLLRALDVPSRLVAVYAPGLAPMDFHAVAEAAIDGVWRVVDATLLAPRSSLARISTGRDAADTAFLSVYGGLADLLSSIVQATVEGDLPGDDVTALVSIP